MIRPRKSWHSVEPSTPPETSVAPSPEEIADVIGRSLLALIIVVEGQTPAGPAAKAYQAAIHHNGEEAAEVGARKAMEAALRFVIDADPLHAGPRERIIDKAWAGLPGWRQ